MNDIATFWGPFAILSAFALILLVSNRFDQRRWRREREAEARARGQTSE